MGCSGDHDVLCCHRGWEVIGAGLIRGRSGKEDLVWINTYKLGYKSYGVPFRRRSVHGITRWRELQGSL